MYSQNLSSPEKLPKNRLSAVYFFYFALLGVWLPYWGLYLDDLGFDGQFIGVVMGLSFATRIIGPYLLAFCLARFARRMLFMRLFSLVSSCCCLPLLFMDDRNSIIALVFLYTLTWNALLPQIEALTLDWLDKSPNRYGPIRSWGSIGFIVAVIALGKLLEIEGSHWVPWLLLFSLLGLTFFLTTVDEHHKLDSIGSSSHSFWRSLTTKPIAVFFFTTFCLQLSHGVYYALFSVYLEDFGYSRSAISYLWTLAVIAEVLLFMAMGRLFVQMSLNQILLLGLIVSGVRWLLLVLVASSIYWVALTQLLHAFSFAAHHGASMVWIKERFGEDLMPQGQAFYTGACFGIGGGLGAYLGGEIWMLSHSGSFIFASVISFFGAFLWYLYLAMRNKY